MDKREEYGDKFTEHLLEEYKLYVRMSDNLSNRRAQTNAFFISLLSALLLIPSLTSQGNSLIDVQPITYVAISVLGLLICCVWYVSIRSYRQLNSAKFEVIHEIEQQLPFACFVREWSILGRGKDTKKYLQLSRTEQYVPVLLGSPFLLVLAYAMYRMLTG